MSGPPASDDPPAPGIAGGALVEQLSSTLDRAALLVRVLETNLGLVAGAGGESGGRAAELERRLSAAEADVKELASRLVRTERQAERLMKLYVAIYQLHATLEPDLVRATIAEIAHNLLGAERFVLLLRSATGEGCEVALREGPELAGGPFAGAAYGGGDPLVDATLADGVARFGPADGGTALAAVPLRIHDEVAGALVILKLMDHKTLLRPEDRDLLDLLSAHAASALCAARLFAEQDRKLRTLESLVQLAKGESG